MTRFLPARIFSVCVLGYGCCAVCLGLRANPSGVQMDIPRVEKDRTRCGEAVRGSKGPFGAEVARCAPFRSHFVPFSPFSLSGPHFALSCSFTHILPSKTPIDAPFSPTRSTSKHLHIPTIYFSFKRSKCVDMVILLFASFGLFLMIQDSD
jgi:hypothetical protein